MSHMEIVVWAWVCDLCGLEAIEGDGLPYGWQEHPSGAHACAVCTAAPALRLVSP